jgi:hypothetical protein
MARHSHFNPIQETYMRTLFRPIAFSLLAVAISANASATEYSSNDWQYSAMLYLWLPDINGTTRYEVPPGSGTAVGVDASKILDSLNMAFMGTFQARKDKWSLMADLIYLDLSNNKNNRITLGPGQNLSVTSRIDMGFKGWTSTGSAAYNLIDDGNARLDVLGGLRIFSYEADTQLTLTGPSGGFIVPASLSKSGTLWDAVVGVKGELRLNDHWFAPYYLDIGTGDTDLTWQAMAGIGYKADWGDVMLNYRHLSYDQDSGKFLQDFSFGGPMLGVRFNF